MSVTTEQREKDYANLDTMIEPFNQTLVTMRNLVPALDTDSRSHFRDILASAVVKLKEVVDTCEAFAAELAETEDNPAPSEPTPEPAPQQ